jgi:hypothetical protein
MLLFSSMQGKQQHNLPLIIFLTDFGIGSLVIIIYLYIGPQGLGASEFFFYYIIQQGGKLTCLHFFKWLC